jgi:hypothetical protein
MNYSVTMNDLGPAENYIQTRISLRGAAEMDRGGRRLSLLTDGDRVPIQKVEVLAAHKVVDITAYLDKADLAAFINMVAEGHERRTAKKQLQKS